MIRDIALRIFTANKQGLEREEHNYNYTKNKNGRWKDDKGKPLPEAYPPKLNNPYKRVERLVRKAWEQIPAKERNDNLHEMSAKVMKVLKKGQL